MIVNHSGPSSPEYMEWRRSEDQVSRQNSRSRVLRNGTTYDDNDEQYRSRTSLNASLTAYILWHASSSQHEAGDEKISDQEQTQGKNPILKYEWIGLLVSCILFLLSGLDGMRYCRLQYENDDPDIAANCHDIFVTKVVPTSLLVALCCIFAILELSLSSRVRVHAVGLAAVLSLVLCGFSIVTVMLVPQTTHNVQQDLDELAADYYYTDDDLVDDDNNNDNAASAGDQAFKEFFFHSPSLPSSLYSINALGEIGDNANLYHAMWCSLIFAFIISHQYLYALGLLHCCKSYLYWKKNKLRTRLFFRHRERVGSWIAILVASSLALICSALLWNDVLRELCRQEFLDDDLGNGNGQLTILSIHPRICSSTELAIMMGAGGVILSAISVLVHSSSQRFAMSAMPLILEGVISGVLVLVYGFGSMFVTGSYQGGLAENVGNLYYATWCCFLFSLRVFIGCVEEAHALDDNETHEENDDESVRNVPGLITGNNTANPMSTSSVLLDGDTRQEHLHQPELPHEAEARNSCDGAVSEGPKTFIKRWCTLALLSAINHGAAYDAAQQMYFTKYGYNTGNLRVMVATYGQMSMSQKWSLACPFSVMFFSAAMAVLHLWPPSFKVVANPTVGLICASITSSFCASQIILSQHAANSLAVNHIGEIVSANLYYFTWGSMVSAATNVAFYLKLRFPGEPKSFEFILWFGLVKIGLVMVGASSHLWLTIKGDCQGSDLHNGDDAIASVVSPSFCWRTRFAFFSGLLVTALAILVSVILVLKWKHVMLLQNVVGCMMAMFFMFGAGWITGMGGPAESVGDLYYSTWLAFALSLVLSAPCIKNVLKDRLDARNNNQKEDEASVTDVVHNPIDPVDHRQGIFA